MREMKNTQMQEDKETVIRRSSARLCVFVCGEPLQCGRTARCTQPVQPTPPLAHLAAYGETSGPPALLHFLMVLRLYRNKRRGCLKTENTRTYLSIYLAAGITQALWRICKGLDD